MKLRLDRYQKLLRYERLTSVVLLAIGSLGSVLSTLGIWIGILLLVVPPDQAEPLGIIWSRRSGVLIIVFFGAFPLLGSLAAFRAGWLRRKKLDGLREVASIASSGAALKAAELSKSMRIHPADAQKLLLVSVESGIIEVEQGESVPIGPAEIQSSGPKHVENLSGSVLNNTWRVEHILGKGGMGIVYVAQHIRTLRRYALKAMIPTENDPASVQRFQREATVVSAVGHPGIVAIHDLGEDSGIHYLVMDLLAGETLEARLTRVGSLDWTEAKKILFEVGQALAAAHEAGVLHRDIKPANIFLAQSPSKSEQAILLDFGLALPLEMGAKVRVTATGAVIGTPLYMSPEQARGEKMDQRSDLFSLAAVLYEMMSGAPPFLDHTLANVYTKLLTSQVVSLGTVAPRPVPQAVDWAVHYALQKDPAHRYPDIRAFLNAVSQV